MASITANGSKGHHKFTLNVSESSYSVANNTSSVSFSFVLSPVQASWNWELWGDKISYSITINGSNYTGTIPNYDGSSSVTLKSGSLTVAHNSDGTKSISYSFSVTDSTGQSYTSGNASASGTLALTTIPRATTPTLSASSVTMGSSVTITMTPASNTFKHKIRYAFGSVTNSVVGLSIGDAFTATGTTTATLTPPTSLGSQIPNAMSGRCTITCYTYTSSGGHIGTTTVNLTLNVPAYNPTISSITFTGNNLLSSTYVQGKSTVTPKITASTVYGATITAYSSVVDGKTYTGSTFTTSALSSGTKTVKTTVTDSRGKTVTADSSSFVVYAYSNPYITTFKLARQTDGTTVIATLVGGVASVNGKNAKTFAVTLNGVTKTITSTTNTVNGTATFTGVSTDKSFEAVAKITDSYTNVSKTAILPTVAVTMDFYKDGNGIALGKVAEQGNLFDVAWNAKFGGEISSDAPEKTISNLTYKGQNPITKASEDTLDFWAAQGNLATCFFTANTVDMNKPSTWGYLLNISSTPGTKEFHQLWLEQSNGSIHHRGANTSSINAWRKMLDSVNCPDYVIEQGTTSGWEYTKWNNGKIELYGEKSLTFPDGTLVATGVNRSIVTLELSSLLKTIVSGTCAVQYSGMIPQVCRHSTYPTRAEIVILTGRYISTFTVTAPVYIIGKWK